MSDTLAERLVAFALNTRYEDLPTQVVVEARRRLVDALGCAIGALDEPASSIARRAAGAFQGIRSVGLIGGGTSAPDWGAFANGVHIRYLDCNDTYLSLEPAHPSDNWAAVMAAGEVVGADGKAWITAAAVAYEVQCRLCDAASIRARGWDHTTYGSISATLAAAKLMGLTHEQTLPHWELPVPRGPRYGSHGPASCRCGKGVLLLSPPATGSSPPSSLPSG